METPAGQTDAGKGLMRLIATLSVAAALTACTPADPAAMRAQNIVNCEQATFPEAQLVACSAVIADESAERAQRAAALVQRGMLRATQGQHARAVADFGRALRLDAANTDALSERGAVHQERGAYDLALRDYDAALALDPRNSIAAYRRDQALQGRVDAVTQQIAQLNEVLAREPQNTAALNNRCWIRAINDEDLNAALADCDAVIRIEPRSANALDSRGLVHLKRGEFAAAMADYEAALAIEPNRGHFLYGRGLARMRLGQAELGQADFVRAEAAEPGIAQAYAGYGRIPDAAAAPASPDAAPVKP
jgi:tetratricopeptide (TPR) repeat protein